MGEIQTWATQKFSTTEGETVGNLETARKEVLAKLETACVPDLGGHYSKWYQTVVLTVSESLVRGNRRHKARGVALLQACLKMVKKTRTFHDGAVMGSYTLVNFFLVSNSLSLSTRARLALTRC